MQAPPSSISSPAFLHRPNIFGLPTFTKLRLHHRRRSGGHVSLASRRDAHDRDFGGGIVDEDMIVLRERIHEMKMVERNYEPPSGWMEWEKRYYERYGSDVYRLVGMIQALLLNIRPSLAVGIVTVVVLSLPVSTVMIVLHLTEMARTFLGGGAS